MTVHILDTPLQLPVPDLSVVNLRRTEMKRHANTLSDSYLPVIKETLTSLIAELNDVDKEALHTLNGVPGLLDTEGLVPLLEALVQLRAKPEDDQSEAIAQIVTEIDSLLTRVSSGLQERGRNLDSALVNFAAVTFGDLDSLIAPINAEIARIDAEIAGMEKPLTGLLEEEAETNKLIHALESVSVFDKLKPLVETLKKLTAIDPKNPLIGLIEAGIEAMSNILNLASDALMYEHLISLRKRIQERLDTLRERIQTLQSHRNKETEKLAQLTLLQGMDALKSEYVREVGKLREALKRFNGYAFTGDDTEHSAMRFMACAGILGTYMDNLRRDWQS